MPYNHRVQNSKEWETISEEYHIPLAKHDPQITKTQQINNDFDFIFSCFFFHFPDKYKQTAFSSPNALV